MVDKDDQLNNIHRLSPRLVPITNEKASRESFEELIRDRIERLPPGVGSLLLVRLPVDDVVSVTGADQLTEAIKSARSLLRQDDMLGRQDKTTFCIFLNHADRDTAERVSVRLRTWLRSFQPLVGIAVFPDDGTSSSQLIAAADSNAF